MDRALLESQLRRLNELALWDFELVREPDDVARIYGSNDFTYYRDAEIECGGVIFTDLPERFSHAQFRIGKDSDDTRITIWIVGVPQDDLDEKEFEIQCAEASVRIEKVLYFRE